MPHNPLKPIYLSKPVDQAYHSQENIIRSALITVENTLNFHAGYINGMEERLEALTRKLASMDRLVLAITEAISEEIEPIKDRCPKTMAAIAAISIESMEQDEAAPSG